MTSGRTMPRLFNRSSMAAMSCLLLDLLHDDKKSIDILGRIEQMWCDSDFPLTQRDHELLVSQRFIESFCITAAADFDATKYTALRGLSRTRQPISVRKSLEKIANQGLTVIVDQRRRRIQHELQRRF